MTEQQRSDRHRETGDVPERDRDGRVEDLLLTGLDHYFAGRYDLAINVWTRVLFLDRGHARARAYIERARGAIAERQREADELVHSGAAAFDRGDIDSARRLLSTAVERGAASEEALALLTRLERLDALPAGVEPAPELRHTARKRAHSPAAPQSRGTKVIWIAAGLLGGLLVAAAAAVVLWIRGDAWLAWTTPPVAAPASAISEPLPVPSASDVAIARGRALYSKGRLHEALSAFESIRPGDPLRAQADACRAAIQRQLLAAARGADAAPPADALRSACEPAR